jgi:hypothetical protein
VTGCSGGVYHRPSETRDRIQFKSWRRGPIGHSRKCHPTLISEKKIEGKDGYTCTEPQIRKARQRSRNKHILGIRRDGGKPVGNSGRIALRRERCDIHPVVGNDHGTSNYITAVIK